MSWLTTIPIIGKVFERLFDCIDEVIEDKDEKNRIKADLSKLVSGIDLDKFAKQLEAQTQIIVAEAQGTSWLQRNWRPGLMGLFGVIIANNYIFNPWLNALFGLDVVMQIPPDMWDLLKLGVSGYIVGRSVEKGIKEWRKPDAECAE